jgi:hypothetical protein
MPESGVVSIFQVEAGGAGKIGQAVLADNARANASSFRRGALAAAPCFA